MLQNQFYAADAHEHTALDQSNEMPHISNLHTGAFLISFPLVKIEDLCQGYLRYKFSSLGALVPLLGRVFIWLSGDPRIPASRGARLLQGGGRRPVVVFSHGLAACRIVLQKVPSEGS